MTTQTDEHYPLDVTALPASWTVCLVGDVTVDVQSGFPTGVHNKEGVGIPHLRPMNISRQGDLDLNDVKYVAADASPLRVEAGDVLFNNTNSPELIGKTASIPQESSEQAFSNHMTRLRTAPGIDPKFVARQLHFLWMSGYFRLRCTNHVNQASISSTTLAATVPLVVAPSEEQSRIVDEIEKQFSRLDVATAALKRLQANLKRYRASVLKAACEGRLVPTEAELAHKESREYEPADKLLERILRDRRAHWEADTLAKMIASGKPPKDDDWKRKYQQPTAPDSTDLPPIPNGWCWTSLGQVFEVSVGATPSRATPEYWNGHIAWVSSGEVAFCRIKSTRETITDLGLSQTSTSLHPAGTVLIGMIGEGKTRGQVAILDIEACNNQNSAAIRVSQAGLPPEYIYRYLEGVYEQTRHRGSGNNQPALNKSRVQEIPFPLPPLQEQIRIVQETERVLSLVASLEATSKQQTDKALGLKRSMLQSAFRGRLVPQDSADEPASALIERIRNGRASGKDLDQLRILR